MTSKVRKDNSLASMAAHNAIRGIAQPRSVRLRAVRVHTQTDKRAALLQKAKAKFRRFFSRGFYDETYMAWERGYKWEAHKEWEQHLNKAAFRRALGESRYGEIAARAVRIESGRSLLFSFEKMALRDAVREEGGAKLFAEGLFEFLYGSAALEERFDQWCDAIAALPRKQTRVFTWPLATVFPFIASPGAHIFLKPNTTKEAARILRLQFSYVSRPNGQTYRDYLALAETVRKGIEDMRPRDMIDIQSFLWVQGSNEYR
jgi:hypothetical protein